MLKDIDNKDGLILVVALWIVAILALLAIGLAQRISLELYLVKYGRQHLKSRFAADASVELASAVLAQDINIADSLNEFWSTGLLLDVPEPFFKEVKLKTAQFSISHKITDADEELTLYGLSDEDSKLNLNTATVHEMQILFSELDIENAHQIASSIVDWADQDETTSFDGAEDDYYASLATPYHCKNAPLSVIEELPLIKGMDEDKFKKIKPFVTVYGDGKININTASETVLRSLLISRGSLDSTARKLAKEVLAYRAGEDGRAASEDDRFFAKFEDIASALSTPLSMAEFAKCVNTLKFKSDFYRAQVRAVSAEGRTQTKVNYILRKDQRGLDKPQLVSWQEE
jgi:general secretion pathway protein K